MNTITKEKENIYSLYSLIEEEPNFEEFEEIYYKKYLDVTYDGKNIKNSELSEYEKITRDFIVNVIKKFNVILSPNKLKMDINFNENDELTELYIKEFKFDKRSGKYKEINQTDIFNNLKFNEYRKLLYDVINTGNKIIYNISKNIPFSGKIVIPKKIYSEKIDEIFSESFDVLKSEDSKYITLNIITIPSNIKVKRRSNKK